MPSAIMGRIVANSIVDMINGVSDGPTYEASMTEIGAACVASAGASALIGGAASMTMYPVSYTHLDVYKRQELGP